MSSAPLYAKRTSAARSDKREIAPKMSTLVNSSPRSVSEAVGGELGPDAPAFHYVGKPLPRARGRGRPFIRLNLPAVEQMIQSGGHAAAIAILCGCSEDTIMRRFRDRFAEASRLKAERLQQIARDAGLIP
jgi:hypothetical protein